MKSLLRIIGLLGLFGGLGAIFYYIALFDATVSVGKGQYVYNIGKMAYQQNMTLVSVGVVILGCVALYFGTKKLES